MNGSGGDAALGSGGSGTASGGDAGATGGADAGSGGSVTTDPNDPTVGCVPSSGAIVDRGDGTVFDPNTCLMWMKEPFTYTEGKALAGDAELTGLMHLGFCAQLNESGHDDWRGPDVAELHSLITECGSWKDTWYWVPEVSNVGTEIFADYWTTTPGDGGEHLCGIKGTSGEVDPGRRADSNVHVRCVRGTSPLTGSVTTCDASVCN